MSAVDSEEAVAIKQELTARIADSTLFLCVGKETYRSALDGMGNSEGGRDEKEARGRQDRFD